MLWGDSVRLQEDLPVTGRVKVKARGINGYVNTSQISKQSLLEYYFIDVGQGDGVLIVTPDRKHILVDGNVVNIASYNLKPGQIISVREKSKSLEAITNSLSARNARQFNWLEWDAKDLAGKFISVPARDQIPEKIQEQLIVELYSKL